MSVRRDVFPESWPRQLRWQSPTDRGGVGAGGGDQGRERVRAGRVRADRVGAGCVAAVWTGAVQTGRPLTGAGPTGPIDQVLIRLGFGWSGRDIEVRERSGRDIEVRTRYKSCLEDVLQRPAALL